MEFRLTRFADLFLFGTFLDQVYRKLIFGYQDVANLTNLFNYFKYFSALKTFDLTEFLSNLDNFVKIKSKHHDLICLNAIMIFFQGFGCHPGHRRPDGFC